jgi:hypothetical protein
MVFGKQKYYLTMLGPHRGERVVASVETEDRYTAEKLFGCGIVDDKGFGFQGLYTEEEVLHMFKPGTDIVGTYNPSVGSCDKHRDYHKVSAFEVIDQKVYRYKASERWLLALDGENIDFSYVKDVMAGKIEPLSITPIGAVNDAKPLVVEQVVKKPVEAEEKVVSFLDAMDTYEEPAFDDPLDMFDEDTEEPDFEDEVPIRSQDLSDVYSTIKTERTASKLADEPDYISDFDASFYAAQEDVDEEDDFRKRVQQVSVGGSQTKPQTGEPLKKQGQSLHDFMQKGFGAGEFHM